MQKILSLGLIVGLSLVSLTSFACPKGTSLVGGTGPHHKGGTCVATGKASPKASPAVSPKTTQSKGKKVPADKAPKTPSADNGKVGTVTNPLN
jgi:hypothetical protein